MNKKNNPFVIYNKWVIFYAILAGKGMNEKHN